MKHAFKIVVAAIVLLGSTVAFAADDEDDAVPGVWYGTVSVGQARNKFDSSFGQYSGGVASTNVTDHKTGLKLGAGYRFNPNFAIEAGYTKLGKFSFNNTLPANAGLGIPNGGQFIDNYTVDALHVSAVGIAPVYKDLSVFGKVGLDRVTVKTEVTKPSAFGTSGSATRTQSKALVGVGLRYDVMGKVGIRAEYEDYGNVGDPNINTSHDSMMSVGLDVKF